jgi:hypothetical protein
MTPTEKLARAREALRRAIEDLETLANHSFPDGFGWPDCCGYDPNLPSGYREVPTGKCIANDAIMAMSVVGQLNETLALLDEPDAAEERPETAEQLRKRLGFHRLTTEQQDANLKHNLDAPPPKPARTVLSDVDPRNMTRLMLLDRVRELEEIVKWKGEHTDALEKNWNSLVEIARAQRDTARERVKELEDEQRWRESENGNLIGDLRRELAKEKTDLKLQSEYIEDFVDVAEEWGWFCNNANGLTIPQYLRKCLAEEKAAHEKTKEELKKTDDILLTERYERVAGKMNERVEWNDALLYEKHRAADIERALADEKSAHEKTKTEHSRCEVRGNGYYAKASTLTPEYVWRLEELNKDLEAKLAEATVAREKDRDEIRLAFQETHASEKK